MSLKCVLFIEVLLLLNVVFSEKALNSTTSGECLNVKESVGFLRKKRYLAFPEGSTFSITAQSLKAFQTHIPSGWNTLYELELHYELFDSMFLYQKIRAKHHREKRRLWDKLQMALETHNMNGRACIVRAICECKKNLAPPGRSLVHDLLRAIFTAPLHETDFVKEVRRYYEDILEPHFCDTYNDCPISILQFVLALNRS